uniref:Uncharacterized protein n=1 Tax=Fundidesulfovibrio putealis TaxID=270496 RepID=A0A7C4EHR2_9BACT
MEIPLLHIIDYLVAKYLHHRDIPTHLTVKKIAALAGENKVHLAAYYSDAHKHYCRCKSLLKTGHLRDSASYVEKENDLNEHLKQYLRNIAKDFFSVLTEYFVSNRRSKPVLSLRIPFVHDDDDYVYTIFRQNGNMLPPPFKVQDSQLLWKVRDTDSAQYCNNIPAMAGRRPTQFTHPRLRQECAQSYSRPLVERLRLRRRHGLDPGWNACWIPVDPSQQQASPEHCYRSSLAAPVSIHSSEMPEVLRQTLGLDGDNVACIFGFLTVDSPEYRYFRASDHDVMALFCNFFTPFLLTQTIFTSSISRYHMPKQLSPCLDFLSG